MKTMANKFWMVLAVALMSTRTALARLTLLRLGNANAGQHLRGLSIDMNNNDYDNKESKAEMDLAARELWTFWSDMSVSMCMEDKPPAVIDIVLSMSMSMDYGLAGLLPEDWEALWPDVGSMSSMSYGYGAVTLGDSPLDGLSVPPVVDDEPASSASTSGEAESSSAADDGSDSTAANVGKDTRASASSSASAPQTVLFIVLVGAAMAVLSAWYVRKNMRGASSNASMMTPVSAPLI